MSEPRQYCTFYAHGLFFGVPVMGVQEVLRWQPMTPIPLAPPAVRGLINLRGQIVVAVDLRRRLGLPTSDQAEPMNVVLRTDEGAVSLLVDEIGDVLEVSEEAYERAPENLPLPDDVVHGVYKLDDRLLLVLDPARAAAAA